MQALLDHDHTSASEEKSDTNVASTFKAITSTNQCLSHLRRAPTIDIRDFSPRVEAASVLRITGDNRTDNTTEEGTRSVGLGPNRHRQHRRSVSPRCLDSR